MSKKSLPVQVVILPGPACHDPVMAIPMKCSTTWLLLILPLGLPAGAAAQSISINLAAATGVTSIPGRAGTFTGTPPEPCIIYTELLQASEGSYSHGWAIQRRLHRQECRRKSHKGEMKNEKSVEK